MKNSPDFLNFYAGQHTSFRVIKRNCTAAHDFKLIWQHLFSEFVFDGASAAEVLETKNNPFDIYEIVSSLTANEHPIFIIDEFDRVKDDEAKIQLSDTIKYFADYGINATIIVVGVASTVSDLIAGHESIRRSLAQISMQRMHPEELRTLIEQRCEILHMTMLDDVKSKMVALSQGLPGYTHLLGQLSASNAIDRRSMIIEDDDLTIALRSAVEESDETVKEEYFRAVRSTKPKNLYKEALLACALAETDERGYFSAKAVKGPYSNIMETQKEIWDFSNHLSAFCNPERGPVLIKEGKPKSYEYRFNDPVLRPYVVIRGIADGLISSENI